MGSWMIDILLYISEDRRLGRRGAQPEQITISGKLWNCDQVWLYLREILRQLVSVGPLNTNKFTRLPHNTCSRGLFFEICKPKIITHPSCDLKICNCHFGLVICHQMSRMYGVVLPYTVEIKSIAKATVRPVKYIKASVLHALFSLPIILLTRAGWFT